MLLDLRKTALPRLLPDRSASVDFANWVAFARRDSAIHDFLDPLNDIWIILRQVFRFSDIRLEVVELQMRA